MSWLTKRREAEGWAPNKSNTLSIVSAMGQSTTGAVRMFRRDQLETLDAYYENRQYDNLVGWVEGGQTTPSTPIRERKPLIQIALAKLVCKRVSSRLVGLDNFPELTIPDDPETNSFLQLVIKGSRLQSHIVEPIRRCLNSGAVFIRFFFVEGVIKFEWYLSKYCYPTFAPSGQLKELIVRYVFSDFDDLDNNGKPKQKWFRLDFGQYKDIRYDTPLYRPQVEPEFTPIEEVAHNFGFVQGEWFRTCEVPHTPDGMSLTEDLLGFIDELNYSVSQSSVAVSYNQDPQLTLTGMDVDEADAMIRSSMKAWQLGRDGKADFLETNLTGVKVAEELRTSIRTLAQDIARVPLLDPEKMVTHAQSGEAMKVLHGPMVELIDELRPILEHNLIQLVTKISFAYIMLMDRGVKVGITAPPEWEPKAFNVVANWPEIFRQTMEDLQKKVSVASAAATANLLSRESMTRWLARDFSIDDVELELQRIAAQPVLNPFGSF